MKSETIRTRLESYYYIITWDQNGQRHSTEEFDTLQEAFEYGLKLNSENDGNILTIELKIEIQNTSDESSFNVVRNETIYIKGGF